jgi:hypothetical protein
MKRHRLINNRGMVRDAGGRRVRAVSAHDLARGDDQDLDSRRKSAVAAIRKLHRDIAWSIAGANFVWICMFVLVWNRVEDRLIGRNAFQGWPRMATIVAALAIFAAVCMWLARARAARGRAGAAVAENLCGSCGYDLKGLPTTPDSDRHVACPECGSTWRKCQSEEVDEPSP